MDDSLIGTVAGLKTRHQTAGLVDAGKGMYGKPNGALYMQYLTEFQTQTNEYCNVIQKGNIIAVQTTHAQVAPLLGRLKPLICRFRSF